MPVGLAAKFAQRPDEVFCLKAAQGAKNARQKDAKIALHLRAGIARDSLTTLLNDFKQLYKKYIHFSLLNELQSQWMNIILMGSFYG